ncbi:hypothetical protein FACS1894137_09740 [Spirochaetia bacterium]|nr:hypothetical protein FACS1894137_09740 [Spirochaetia bacterium]
MKKNRTVCLAQYEYESAMADFGDELIEAIEKAEAPIDYGYFVGKNWWQEEPDKQDQAVAPEIGERLFAHQRRCVGVDDYPFEHIAYGCYLRTETVANEWFHFWIGKIIVPRLNHSEICFWTVEAEIKKMSKDIKAGGLYSEEWNDLGIQGEIYIRLKKVPRNYYFTCPDRDKRIGILEKFFTEIL